VVSSKGIEEDDERKTGLFLVEEVFYTVQILNLKYNIPIS